MIFLGCIAFLLYFIYDFNQGWLKKRLLQPCFFIGSLLLCYATGKILYNEFIWPQNIISVLLIMLSLINAVLLFYTLFLAIPFEKTYLNECFETVVDTGVYGLCRHPGVLFFSTFYLFMALGIHSMYFFGVGVIFSVLNFLYVLFQDKIYFPKCFKNYGTYQKLVPFIIPNKQSLMRCIKTWHGKGGK